MHWEGKRSRGENGGAGGKRNRQQQKTGSRAGKRRWEEKSGSTVFGKIPVTVGRGILFLEIAQIVYAETDGRGCVVHTTSRSYEVNQLLGELEKKLVDLDSSDP